MKPLLLVHLPARGPCAHISGWSIDGFAFVRCVCSPTEPAFGLALLTPLIAVIVLFHVFLNPQGIALAIVLVVCAALLYRAYAPRYASLFAAGNR